MDAQLKKERMAPWSRELKGKITVKVQPIYAFFIVKGGRIMKSYKAGEIFVIDAEDINFIDQTFKVKLVEDGVSDEEAQLNNEENAKSSETNPEGDDGDDTPQPTERPSKKVVEEKEKQKEAERKSNAQKTLRRMTKK